MTQHPARSCVKLILMYLTGDMMDGVEARYGRPVVAAARAEFGAHAFGLLEYCARKNRRHDVTLFIRHASDPPLASSTRFAVIRKPNYPPGVFRPPSGGVEPGEPFEVGAAREALEETGLAIRLERYMLRVDAEFTCGERRAPWVTHVFLATALDHEIVPRDTHEIAEARWAPIDTMVRQYRRKMLSMESAGMRYRVELQDVTLRLLGWPGIGEGSDEADVSGGTARGAGRRLDGVPGLGDPGLLLLRSPGVPGAPGGSGAD